MVNLIKFFSNDQIIPLQAPPHRNLGPWNSIDLAPFHPMVYENGPASFSLGN